MVEDRDFSGGVVARHGDLGESNWADQRAFHTSNVKGGLGAITFPGGSSQISGVNPPPLSPDREDGYGNVFQGVRVYDQTMAQWTAPDAYAGDVHDPMSQKPFMWCGNSPLAFGDPSGFDKQISDDRQKEIRAMVDAAISDGFNSADEAAYAANYAYGQSPNDKGDNQGHERGTSIYADKGDKSFGFAVLNSGEGWGSASGWDAGTAKAGPVGTHTVGYWHVHPPNGTSVRQSMSQDPAMVGRLGEPIYTGFSAYPGLVYVQRDSNPDHFPSVVAGNAPPCQVGDMGPC